MFLSKHKVFALSFSLAGTNSILFSSSDFPTRGNQYNFVSYSFKEQEENNSRKIFESKLQNNSVNFFREEVTSSSYNNSQIFKLSPKELTLEIEKKKEKNLFFVNDYKENISNNSLVGKVFSKIEKESKVSVIDKDLKEKLLKSLENLKDSTKNFQEATKEVKAWTLSMKSFSSLQEKDLQELLKTPFQEFNALDKNGKESLKLYYEEFFKLLKEEKILLESLTKVDSSILFEKNRSIEQKINNYEEVLKSLGKINWTQEDQNHEKEFLNKDWNENNPYFYLLDKDEWDLMKKSSETIAKTVKKSSRENGWRRLCSVLLIIFQQSEACYNDELTVLKDNLLLVRKILDLKIGSKLLSDMNLISEKIKIISFKK